jgi:ABC-type nitrate/sulfonate/bicarbonate transport system substrate-binding protein
VPWAAAAWRTPSQEPRATPRKHRPEVIPLPEADLKALLRAAGIDPERAEALAQPLQAMREAIARIDAHIAPDTEPADLRAPHA